MKTVSLRKIIEHAKEPNVQAFLLFAEGTLRDHGFRVRLQKTKLIALSKKDANNKSTGYFSTVPRELVVAVNRPFEQWFNNIFVHEFAHFLQWKTRTPASRACEKSDSLEKVWDWIDGKIELSQRQKDIHFLRVKEMETECERMAMKLMESFNLPIDKKKYWKDSKKYLKIYDYAKRHRKWKIVDW